MELAGTGLRYRVRRALRQIGEQHRQLRDLHDGLRAALASGAQPDAREAFARYRDAVAAHFELEEEVFFPALHGLHPQERTELDALGRDHDALRAALERLLRRLEPASLPDFAPAFEAFRREFASHEKREEALVSRSAEEL